MESSDIDEAQAVVGLYLLFARLLNEEMNPALREILIQPAVLEILSMAEPEVVEYLRGDWTDADYESAAVDFCNTFILPERCNQPRAAAWLAGGDSISAEGIHSVVKSFVEQLEISIPEEFVGLPFDHASVLFFLSAMLRETENPQGAEFEELALGSWIHLFGKAIQSSESPLYQALGRLIEAA